MNCGNMLTICDLLCNAIIYLVINANIFANVEYSLVIPHKEHLQEVARHAMRATNNS